MTDFFQQRTRDDVEEVSDVLHVATTGSDFNNGFTKASAIQTIERALKLAPDGQGGGFIIQIDTIGTYQAGFSHLAFGIPLAPFGAPVAIIGAPETITVLHTVTEVAGDPSGQTITVGAPTFVGDLSDHAFVRCVSSVTPGMVGTKRMISRNTPTTIRLNTPFSVLFGPTLPILASDIFIVEEPQAVIQYDLPFLAPTSILGLKGLTLRGSPGFSFLPMTGFLVTEEVILDLNGGGSEIGYGANWKTGDVGTDFLFGGQGGAPFNAGGNNGCGTILKNGVLGFGGRALDGFLVTRNILLDIEAGVVNIIDIDAKGTEFYCVKGAKLQLTPNFASLSPTNRGTVDGTGLAPGTAPIFYDGGLGDINLVDIINAGAAPAIRAGQRAFVALGDVGGSTGNTDVGLEAVGRAHIAIDPVGTVVTGTTDDTRVQATLKAYGALPFTDAGGSLSRIAPAGQ